MGTSIVEFRKLREVRVFFYLDILCLKSHENGFECYECETLEKSKFSLEGKMVISIEKLEFF